MRTADEIFRKIEIEKPPIFRSYLEAAVIGIKAIRIAQTEAWNEAIKTASENARVKPIYDAYNFQTGGHYTVDRDSILKLMK